MPSFLIEPSDFFTQDMGIEPPKKANPAATLKQKLAPKKNTGNTGESSGSDNDDSDDEEEDDEKAANALARAKNATEPYRIFMFGRLLTGHTITVEIVGFMPFFYIELPSALEYSAIPYDTLSEELIVKYKLYTQPSFLTWKKLSSAGVSPQQQLKYFMRWLTDKLQPKRMAHMVKGSLEFRKRANGFDFCQERPMVKLCFTNTLVMRIVCGFFISYDAEGYKQPVGHIIPGVTFGSVPHYFSLYETHHITDPLIKFFHARNIRPCSWIECRGPVTVIRTKDDAPPFESVAPSHRERASEASLTDIHVVVDAEQLFPLSKMMVTTRRRVLTYDIECRSHTGAFPSPTQNYNTFVTDVTALWQLLISSTSPPAIWQTDKAKALIQEYKTDPYRFLEHVLYIGYHNQLHPKIQYLGLSRELHFGEIRHLYTKNKVIPRIDKIAYAARAAKDAFGRLTTMFRTGEGSRDDMNRCIYAIQNKFNELLPCMAGDEIIQISMCFSAIDKDTPYANYMIVWGSCDDIPDCTVISCATEKDVLMAFYTVLRQHDPDIISGYNINRFDTLWLVKRAMELGIADQFLVLGRLANFKSALRQKFSKFGAKALEQLEYIVIPGRIQFDLLEAARSTHDLNSYSLDNVVAEFINGVVTDGSYDAERNETTFTTNSIYGLRVGNSIALMRQQGLSVVSLGKDMSKLEIIGLRQGPTKDKGHAIVVQGNVNFFTVCRPKDEAMLLDLPETNRKDNTPVYKWTLGKNDMTPQRIFSLHLGNSSDRAAIAKYCLIDSQLCVLLLRKHMYIFNKICEADAVQIPLGFIISRGMNVRTTSGTTSFMKRNSFTLHMRFGKSTATGYEGAIVLTPKVGMYIDRAVGVLDFASLYPSSMRELNISFETIVTDPFLCSDEGKAFLEELGYIVADVEYDTFDYPQDVDAATNNSKKRATRIRTGTKRCRFIQNGGKAGFRGILSGLQDYVVSKRKFVREKAKYVNVTFTDGRTMTGIYLSKEHQMRIESDVPDSTDYVTIQLSRETDVVASVEDAYDETQKQVFNCMQLSLKVVANSVYGGLGGPTSPLFFIDLAASVTAVGRSRLKLAIDIVTNPKNFPQTMDNGEVRYLRNEVIYGDTDSVFVLFEAIDGQGNMLTGIENRKRTIELGQLAQEIAGRYLNHPQELEYEKTLHPHVMIRAKGYASILYEFDPYKGKLKYQGIVLKRRDNATIVKIIYSNVLSCIMNNGSIRQAEDMLQKMLMKFVTGDFRKEFSLASGGIMDTTKDFGIASLVITKKLGVNYKDPEKIAHWVLAQRIGERDPGKKPKPGDRISYIHFNPYFLQKEKNNTHPDNQSSAAPLVSLPKAGPGKRARLPHQTPLLQGDKIEEVEYFMSHPEYVPDYEYYLNSQLKQPIAQLFALRLEELQVYEKYLKTSRELDPLAAAYKNILASAKEKHWSESEIEEHMMEFKIKLTGELLFEPALQMVAQMQGGASKASVKANRIQRNIPGQVRLDTFFKKTSSTSTSLLDLQGDPSRKKISASAEATCCFAENDT
jgi:DNA polymerase elongation subunit (family B)